VPLKQELEQLKTAFAQKNDASVVAAARKAAR
jgi:hypothetical protein